MVLTGPAALFAEAFKIGRGFRLSLCERLFQVLVGFDLVVGDAFAPGIHQCDIDLCGSVTQQGGFFEKLEGFDLVLFL